MRQEQRKGRKRYVLGALENGFRHAVDELAQHVRMNGADDTVVGKTAFTRGQLEPARPARIHDHPRNLRVTANLAAVVLDATHQCVRQLARTADRLRDAEGVHDSGHQECAHAGTEFVRHLQVLGNHPHNVQFHQLAFEEPVHHVERAARHDVEQETTFVALIHHRGERAERGRRGVQTRRQHRQRFPARLHEPAVGLGVPRREFGDALAGAVEILPCPDDTAVFEDRHPGHLGVVVPEPEIAEQPQFVLAQQRVALEHDVNGAVLVVPVTGQRQFARGDAAAVMRLAFEHQHALAGPGQVRGCDEPIVARPHHDDIVG